MSASAMRLAAWGVLLGLVAVGAAFVVANRARQEAPAHVETETRNVRVTASPAALRTGVTSTVTVAAVDGEDGPLDAWAGASLDAWLVRSDLVYADRVRGRAGAASHEFVADLRPTQPGRYALVASGIRPGLVTIGAASLSVTGPAEDVPPVEQSAGREGFAVLMGTIPDTAAIRADEPVAMTYTVSRTDAAVPLDDEDGARGSLAAFSADGRIFVRGEPQSSAYLPSRSSAAFSLVFPEPGRYRVFFAFAVSGRAFMEARWIEVLPAE